MKPKKKKQTKAEPGPLAVPILQQLQAIEQRVMKRLKERGALPEPQPEKPEPSRSEKLEQQWDSLCSPAMQETERGKLPARNHEIGEILSHPIARRGLCIVGQTGLGKTRCAWLLLEREHRHGLRLQFYDFMDFAAKSSRAYYEGREHDFFEDLCSSRLLFLDDVGKASMTARTAEALFTVTDRRMNLKRPMLWTTNYTPGSFKQKLLNDNIDPETVEGLIRRMRDSMTFITLVEKRTPPTGYGVAVPKRAVKGA